MSTALQERPALETNSPRADGGGAPARRAMARWAWRLFRREWRRQVLVLGLLVVAVAATTVGLGVASTLSQLKADPTFGTANTIITLPGTDVDLTTDIAALRAKFGILDVVYHQDVAVPGSASTLDLRAEGPNGPFVPATLRLDAGSYPSRPGQVALTSNVAKVFGVHLGGLWREGGRTWRVVGLAENPLNLFEQFALVAPGQLSMPTSVSILLNASQTTLQDLNLPGSPGAGIESRGSTDKAASEAIVLVLGSMGLLFVGLMAVAGFTVMAQRRMRALGMLGALGATDRHLRTVMLTNGAVVGACAALAGAVTGLVAWFAFAPTLQSMSARRVDSFALPWWGIGAAMALAVATAIAAAWWPARAVARIPVVAALSGRPPRPQPAHRLAALGGILLAAGLAMLTFSDKQRPPLVTGGAVTTVLGLLFLAPLAVAGLGVSARRAPLATRLAVRDLARYQARSGAALGAVTLAIGIAATIAISASASGAPSAAGNLPANQLNVYVASPADGPQVPRLTPSQLRAADRGVQQLAAVLEAKAVVPLYLAYNPVSGAQPGAPGSGATRPAYPAATLAQVNVTPRGENVGPGITLYAATPALLAHFGIKPSEINAATDVISSQSGLGGLQIFDPAIRPGGAGTANGPHPGPPPSPGGNMAEHPVIQAMAQLPDYSSDPTTLLTARAMKALDLEMIPAGWLVQTGHALTTGQVDGAQASAAASGLFVEARTKSASLAELREWSTTIGILLALGVLGMTVGLIRSEAANDLRTLAATGATSAVRRTLTASTAGILAILGALIGTSGAYLALLAWYRSDLSSLGHVPVANIVAIVAGLPVVAFVGGWLLSGRQPPVLAHKPLE